jgi:predicted DNA-binding protein (MmcQ/YjbR family)
VSDIERLREQVRAFALALPETWADTPWEDDAVAKVGKKIFAFFGVPEPRDDRLHLGVKLPHSAPAALTLYGASPMGYGLGKAGWVSLDLPPESVPPWDQLADWIVESYLAVAPKRAAKLLADRPPVER